MSVSWKQLDHLSFMAQLHPLSARWPGSEVTFAADEDKTILDIILETENLVSKLREDSQDTYRSSGLISDHQSTVTNETLLKAEDIPARRPNPELGGLIRWRLNRCHDPYHTETRRSQSTGPMTWEKRK